MKFISTTSLLIFLTVSLFAQIQNRTEKMLFIGNSFTYYNGGLEKHFMLFSASAKKAKNIIATRATKGGATLRILHNQKWVHDSIRNGYDVVVLQEDIPELTEHNTTAFFDYATLFHKEINETGSKSVLFMAWPYERLNWISMDQIAEAHQFIGKKLGIPVAPVGLALMNALKERPSLAMLGKDKEHETIHGSYLAVCVIYATIFKNSPVGATYYPTGISPEEAQFLQKNARKTVKTWNSMMKNQQSSSN
jgi:hypothetical protein